MGYIEVKNVTKSYPNGDSRKTVLKDINLDIQKGEFICLLGASGCGKTTLLNLIAGFEESDSGEIVIDGKEVKTPSKDYITIFQDYGLLPWRTAYKNVLFGLENSDVPKEERKDRVKKYLKLVGLDGKEDLYPGQLSGGMQQRVAIARALSVEPEILFMDEPFGALDAITRMKLQDDLTRIVREEKRTVVFVTHDIEEAVFLADRIVILRPDPGRIAKIVEVKLGKQRDRTKDTFHEVRDKVLSCFEPKIPDKTEYYI